MRQEHQCEEKHMREAREVREQIIQNFLGHGMDFSFYAKEMVSKQEKGLDLQFKTSFAALWEDCKTNRGLTDELKVGSEKK